jgi:hypothetical protein
MHVGCVCVVLCDLGGASPKPFWPRLIAFSLTPPTRVGRIPSHWRLLPLLDGGVAHGGKHALRYDESDESIIMPW